MGKHRSGARARAAFTTASTSTAAVAAPARRRQRPKTPPSPPPPPPPPATIARPPPPAAAATSLPLAAAFYPLLSQRVLDAVDVCELGCVCRDLAACVRAFWQGAERAPGSQRRLLRVADGDGDEGDKEQPGAGPAAVTVRREHWSEPPPDDAPFENDDREWRQGLPTSTRQMFHVVEGCMKAYASKEDPCACCGGRGSGGGGPAGESGGEEEEQAPPVPPTPTYPYPFTWPHPGCGDIFLCRACYTLAAEFRPPQHSREAFFALESLERLGQIYGEISHPQISECAIQFLCGRSTGCSPVLDMRQLQASVRRVAALALARTTPGQVRRRWEGPPCGSEADFF